MIFVALVGAAIAALAAYGCTGWVRRWAERGQLLDIPNERSSHARPMPRGGGLAIAGTVLVGTVFWALWQPPQTWLPILAYVAGAGAVATHAAAADSPQPSTRRIACIAGPWKRTLR